MLCKWTKTIVQDKVCIDWTAAATAAIIYADNISQDIYASGYLKVDTGTGPVTIVFYSGGVTGTAVETIVVATGSSASLQFADLIRLQFLEQRLLKQENFV